MSWLDRFRQTPPPADVALIANAVPKKKKAPAPHSYFCTNNECDHALAGLTLKDAAFGCMLCSPPVAPADVSKEVRAAVEQGEPTRCPQHPLMPVVPRCPEAKCSDPLLPAAHVGLWAPPNGGKTISCVAFNHELPTRLTRRTGVAARSLYSRGAFPTVRNDGALPVKTDPGHHHTTRFTLKHRDWDVPRRIELTDMSGEYYEDLLGDAKGDKVRLRRSMMLQTREAMFLIDPETCAGLGAAIDKSLEEPLRNLFSTYSKSALLAGLGQDDLRELLLHQKQILQGARYPPGGESNGNYKSLAARLSDAALQFVTPRTGVSLSDAHLGAQVQTIDEHLTFIAQLERPSGHTQLNDLAGFLETWGCPRHADGRLDIRLALVVSKSDMLTCDLPDDGEILADVDATSPWSAWSRRLEALSHASRLVLEEFESKLVETADSSFRTVGFFFMSSLGRPVDYTISGTSDIRTIAGADASGARTLSPRGVMWPLLWLAGDDAR